MIGLCRVKVQYTDLRHGSTWEPWEIKKGEIYKFERYGNSPTVWIICIDSYGCILIPIGDFKMYFDVLEHPTIKIRQTYRKMKK